MSLASSPAAAIRNRSGGASVTARGLLRAPGARPVLGVGDLIGWPVLRAQTGAALDLEGVAADRAVILAFDPDLSFGRATALHHDLSAAGIDVGTRTIVIVPDLPAMMPGARQLGDGPLTIAVDAGCRFAHMLGLAEAGSRKSYASLMPAMFVVNAVGCVVWARIDPAAHLASLLPEAHEAACRLGCCAAQPLPLTWGF